jgi:hypothetical protein
VVFAVGLVLQELFVSEAHILIIPIFVFALDSHTFAILAFDQRVEDSGFTLLLLQINSVGVSSTS